MLYCGKFHYFCVIQPNNIINLYKFRKMQSIQTTKDKYRKLCEDRCDDIPIFMQAWWMEAVCVKKNWDVLLFEKGEIIMGALPFLIIKKFGFKCIIEPQLSQFNGVWLNYKEISNLKKQNYSVEKEILNNLIQQLESLHFHYFNQNFHYSFTNWQPFYWRGFKQTTYYTYRINGIADTNKIFSEFHIFKQRHILKAKKKTHVDFNMSIDEFYKFHSNSLSSKGKKVYYKAEFFKNMAESAINRNQGAIISIKDNDENIHSAMFVVWDINSAYYLVSAIDPKYKSSGASILMVWEAILFLTNKTQIFDFEGSMIEGVAKANQEFGAELTPYFNISKNNSLLFSLLLKFKK